MYQVFKKEFMKLVIKCIEQNFSETSEIYCRNRYHGKMSLYPFFTLSDSKTFYAQLIYPPPPPPPPPKAIYSKRA